MSTKKFTLDYLIDIINEVNRHRYVDISQFANRAETQRILYGLTRLGIVEKCKEIPKPLQRNLPSSTGRRPAVYKLIMPYREIRLGDIYHLVPGLSDVRLRLCELNKDLLLCRLAKIEPLDINDVVSCYGPEIMLHGLNRLSLDNWSKHSGLYTQRFAWADRRWLSHLSAVGVVKNKYGFGYKLCKPLTQVKIADMLPYLCYRSTRRQTYNRLFHRLKSKPVSILMPPYLGGPLPGYDY